MTSQTIYSSANRTSLLAAVLISLLFLSTSALTSRPRPASSAAAPPGLQPPGPELVERRTAYAKHFRRSDGGYQAWISNAPLHSRDASGRWQDSAAPQTSINLTPSHADTFLFNSPLSGLGSWAETWVGFYGAAGRPVRALLSWNLSPASGIPASANLDEDASAVTVQLYQTGYYGSPTSMFIALYSASSGWTENGADWFQAANGIPWTTPGGDYDTLLALNSVDGTAGYKSWYSQLLRDDVALERSLYYDPLGSYGAFTYGYLLKTTQESGDYYKYFGARENTDPAKRPVMVVNYSDPIALAHRTPVTRRVPSPDSFTLPPSVQWRAVGLRQANPDASYTLSVFEDSGYLHREGGSTSPGPVEFVTIAPEAPDGAYYPRAYATGAQTGSYSIEYVERLAALGTLDPGDSFGPSIIQPQNVLSLFSFTGVADSASCLRLTPTSGDAQLGLAVFRYAADVTPLLQGRQLAHAAALATAPGQPVAVSFPMPTAGAYALLVWNQGSTTLTTFNLQVCQAVYLPVIRK